MDTIPKHKPVSKETLISLNGYIFAFKEFVDDLKILTMNFLAYFILSMCYTLDITRSAYYTTSSGDFNCDRKPLTHKFAKRQRRAHTTSLFKNIHHTCIICPNKKRSFYPVLFKIK